MKDIALIAASCCKCGATGTETGLRVVCPRTPYKATSFDKPEIRCRSCCQTTKGMFRLSRMTLSDYYARPTST